MTQAPPTPEITPADLPDSFYQFLAASPSTRGRHISKRQMAILAAALATQETLIYAISGRRGSGKSTLATHLCAQAHRAGVSVIHNGPLYFGELMPMAKIVQMPDELEGGILFIDEMQVYANAYRATAFSVQTISTMLQQARKRGLTVIWTSNDAERVAGPVMTQTDIVLYVKSPDRGATVYWQAVDYHGAWSPGSRKRFAPDRRRTINGALYQAFEVWPLFDTRWIADLMESVSLTKEAVQKEIGDKEALDDSYFIRQVLLELREAGSGGIAPGALAEYIHGNYQDPDGDPLRYAPRELGRIMAALGLTRGRTNTSAVYELAPGWLERKKKNYDPDDYADAPDPLAVPGGDEK